MSDLKNGDIVELTSGLVNNLYHGDRLKFITSDGDSALLSQTIIVSKHIFKKVEEFKPNYEQSNRYKLSQFIKAQPYKAIELSVAIGHQATYLSSTASKSRFESRGDISDTQLKEIKEKILISVDFNKHLDKFDSNSEFKEKIEKMDFKITKLKLPDFKFNQPNQAPSEIKTPSIHGTVKAFPDLDSYTPIQCKESKPIQASKKTVWFTVFLITVLIVSLLATLIYLA